MEITLINAIFGIGNKNQTHVHRNNTLNLNSQAIDQLRMEQHQGGISANSINQIASQSGGVSTQPQGYVNIEEGWNVRRGLGMLRFNVSTNALNSTELSVLGYVVGGATPDGIPSDTMFVPVRCWETHTRNVADNDGLPMATTAITNSSQFLLGDPFASKELTSMRPIDVAESALGFMGAEEDGEGASYQGTLDSDLGSNLVLSKTENLNPTHYSKELIKVGVNSMDAYHSGLLTNQIADSISSGGMLESSYIDNPFVHAMMQGLGSFNLAGFQGWSIGEINSVFSNLPDVMNLTLLNQTSFADIDNTLLSHEYGSASMFEIIATELAYLTVHLLIKAGLTHLTFTGTNDPHHFGGIEGSEDGIEIIAGEFSSVLDHDNHAVSRVETFKELLKTHFFRKYLTGYAHNTTFISVEVSCSLFGETSVTLFFNGEEHNKRTYVNATYAINRTSTNISGSEVSLLEGKNLLTNIRDHFS